MTKTSIPTPDLDASAEGTIQFAYDLQPADADQLPDSLTHPLCAWRQILWLLKLVGQLPGRYGDFGFGNLSARDPANDEQFIITASQTGALEKLSPSDLVRIVGYRLDRFWVEAKGSQPPSSETLTHAMLYQADPRIRWIFHVHSPDIWQAASRLKLACTGAEVTYGSADMVAAVNALLLQQHSRPLTFATLGHQDGIFCCGAAARDTGTVLVDLLAKAFMLGSDND